MKTAQGEYFAEMPQCKGNRKAWNRSLGAPILAIGHEVFDHRGVGQGGGVAKV
jgi:hypothetical protein